MTTEQQTTPIAEIVTETWLESRLKIVKDFFQKYIIGIIIVTTVAAASYIYLFHGNTALAWNVAASGIGAALFKAFQFSGIFKKEAMKGFEEIVNSKNFEEKVARSVVVGGRIDSLSKLTSDELYEIWSEASRQLCSKKFSSISSKLHELISKNYLPVHSRYYCGSLDVEIRVKKFADGYLETEEIFKGELHSDSTEKFSLPVTAYYDFEKAEGDTGWIDATIKVFNGTRDHRDSEPIVREHYTQERSSKIDADKRRRSIVESVELGGSCDYYFVRTIKKRYTFKRNETKHFTFTTITKKITVALCMYPDVAAKLQADYVQVGTIAAFAEDEHELDTREHATLCLTYGDLLLPSQGFMFHFKEK